MNKIIRLKSPGAKRPIENQVAAAYNSGLTSCNWSLEDCISLFREYYNAYLDKFGQEHPHLSDNTVKDILNKIDHVYDSFSNMIPLKLEDYPPIIEAYLNQSFENCNYSISHFMSGNIRLYRLYDTGNY